MRPGQEKAFEDIWQNRESKLPEMDGFVEFHLFRGASDEEATIYLSHTLWRDQGSIDGWQDRRNFRGSHKGVHNDIYCGPWRESIWGRPELEFYDSVQCISATD